MAMYDDGHLLSPSFFDPSAIFFNDSWPCRSNCSCAYCQPFQQQYYSQVYDEVHSKTTTWGEHPWSLDHGDLLPKRGNIEPHPATVEQNDNLSTESQKTTFPGLMSQTPDRPSPGESESRRLKRQKQNRLAQRAHRAKQRNVMSDLEEKLQAAEARYNDLYQRNCLLEAALKCFVDHSTALPQLPKAQCLDRTDCEEMLPVSKVAVSRES